MGRNCINSAYRKECGSVQKITNAQLMCLFFLSKSVVFSELVNYMYVFFCFLLFFFVTKNCIIEEVTLSVSDVCDGVGGVGKKYGVDVQ